MIALIARGDAFGVAGGRETPESAVQKETARYRGAFILVPLLSIVIQMLIGLLRLQRSNILKGLAIIAAVWSTFTD